jgi:hypothetical protein
MTFVESLPDPTDGPDPGWKTRNVGTLLMSGPGFIGMVEYLNAQRKLLIEQGMIHAPS